MKTIYNTYVLLKSQAQANYFKEICIINNLPIWDYEAGFMYYNNYVNVFSYDNLDNEFYCFDINSKQNKLKEKVTESEWLELLKQHQCTE